MTTSVYGNPLEPMIDDVKHYLKSWVGLFDPILDGTKTHDIRVMDRDYQIGDRLCLQEYDPLAKEYTGRYVVVEITYITSGAHKPCFFSPFTLHPAMAVLSIQKV